ncbi:MAG TPA: LysM peptidoglycan-binding domain-containing protein [Anaerolineae bacterium]|nr:LysM peptidoglycan-binding domain-containing protein [Anaerolineae bacterium]
MTPRRWAVFIIVNIIVSALTTLLVLNLWDANRSAPRAVVPTTVPTLNATAQTQVAATVKAPTTTPTPANVQKYTVQSGDTLSEIARKFDVSVDDIKALNNLPNPDILSEGQVLLIPGSPLTPTPTRVPIPTSTHAPLPVITGTASTALGDFFVTIREIKGAGSLANEQVTLTNLSGQVNMAGWTMTDGEGNQFTFPSLSLLSKGEVTVHTGKGTNTPTDLYWGQTAPIWASGKVAYLRDPNGKLIATYQVP